MSTVLEHKTILITRPEDQYKDWADYLSGLGAHPVSFPLIRIEPVPYNNEMRMALEKIHEYDWVIFSSVNAAKYLLNLLDADTLKTFKASIAAVGGKTALFLGKNGLKVDFIPDEYTGEKLGATIPEIAWKRVLIPRTNIADDSITKLLRRRGAYVDEIVVYTTEIVKNAQTELQELINKGTDVITFASPSAVEAFSDMKIDPKGSLIACIGPVTSKKAVVSGLTVDIQPEIYTAEGLTNAIIKYYETI